MGRSYEVKLNGRVIDYTWYDLGYEKRESERITPTTRQWKAIHRKLDRFGIWNWAESYSNPDVVDGTSWSVLIHWSDQKIESQGSNGYPERFDKILTAVSTLIGKRAFA